MWHILRHKSWLLPCSIWRCCVTTDCFIEILWEKAWFCWKSDFSKYLYFVNKIYLLCCCVNLCCLPAPQAGLTWFPWVIVLWVSTAKRKTRLHTDFQSAHHLKQINPLKITLSTQLLHVEAAVHWLGRQLCLQCLHYDTFILRMLRSQLWI